ncbi:MAG: hypothetical protein V4722_25750 [Bacteroidota bacterium]
MNKRKREILIVSFLLVCILTQVVGQVRLPVNNMTVRYGFRRYSMQLLDSNKATPSKCVIEVAIPTKQKAKLKLVSSQQWLQWLKSDSTDWAANLILYDLYQRDADIYYGVIKNKKDWLLVGKESEIDYWNRFLESK